MFKSSGANIKKLSKFIRSGDISASIELVDLKNETRQQQDDNPAQKDTVLFLQEITKRIENIADQVDRA